jgi:hypothetical protein
MFLLPPTTEKPYDVNVPLRPKEEEKEKGVVPGMKSEEREKMINPYLEKFGELYKIMNLVGEEKTSVITSTPPPLAEPVMKFSIPKIGGEDEKSLISEIKKEETKKNEVKDLRTPIMLPEEPKKEIKTVDAEQPKTLNFENNFLDNFNKMNEVLDRRFSSQESSVDLSNKNIQKNGEINTQILSTNVKLSDDFTKGISNITNVENNEVNQKPTTELRMTDEIKDLLSKNQSQTLVDKLTTVPSILNQNIKLPDNLANVKPEVGMSTKVNEDIITTTKKTTELFNDISKIYNPNSLITKIDESNRDLYGTINKVITPVRDESVANVKPPVTTVPISNVIPPAITNVSNVLKTETVTKDVNHKFDDIKGDITINVPNMPNLESALNNPQFIGDLQRKIVNHVVNQKIMEGTGNYSYNV